MSKTFKLSEVAEHKKPDSLWIVVEGDVYDVTKVCLTCLPTRSLTRRQRVKENKVNQSKQN